MMKPLLSVILCLGAVQTLAYRKGPTPPGCSNSGDCAEQQACVNGGCVDVCSWAGCGVGTECKAYQHTASCTPTAQPLPLGLDCSLECAGNDQCPPDRSCLDHRCVDPCPGRCGTNSTCRVVNNVPSCACLPGHSGDPFKACGYNPGGECILSWPPLASGVKKFKAESAKKMDWLEAVLQCLRNGQRLATVRNPKELEDIKKVIRDTNVRGGNFWIGGTARLHKREWFWFTHHERIGAFTDWMQGQPDSEGGEDCLEFWETNQQIGYKWNDRPCDHKYYHVCEYYE